MVIRPRPTYATAFDLIALPTRVREFFYGVTTADVSIVQENEEDGPSSEGNNTRGKEEADDMSNDSNSD